MSNVPPPPPPSGDPQGPPPSGGYASPPPSGAYSTPGGPAPVPAGGGMFEPGGIFSPRFQMTEGPPAGWAPKSKMTAGILAILIGGLGIHAFYLGNSKKGIMMILSNILCLGGIWGLIDGIMILTGKETTDAYGVPLAD